MFPEFNEASLLNFFTQYAYEPTYVYSFIIAFMFASSFGLPVPEELTLISAGLVAHMANHPGIYPPPYPGAEGVDTLTLSLVALFAVFGSDFVVYGIGRMFGPKIIKTKFFQGQVAGNGFNKINDWFDKYGGWPVVFSDLPLGLRFPGHLSCGMLGIPAWKFIAVDGLAALISVPTQIYFISVYGSVVLEKLAEVKMFVLYLAAAMFMLWLLRLVYLKNVQRNN